MSHRFAEKNVCITGIGQSDVARPSAKSALSLTVDACALAIKDAGLELSDIDGISTYPGPIINGDGFSPVGATDLQMAMRLNPTWMSASVPDGHSHMSAIFNAIHALAAGTCEHVLVFRTIAQASAKAEAPNAMVFGGRSMPARVWGGLSWLNPYYAISPANIVALTATAHFHKYGTTPEQLGALAVHSRKMAALNPNAIFKKVITIDDYLASRMITSPLRVFDCDVPIDGSTAIVLSQKDIAKDLRNPPIYIEAMGMSPGAIFLGQQADYAEIPCGKAGNMMWSRTDLKPRDIDVAQIYDGFSIFSLYWLEGLGFCGRGESGPFLEGGARIGLDGELPMNTSGGQLAAGRFHGYGHTYEACMQLWGRCGARQVPSAKTTVVCNGGAGFGTLLLRTDS